MTKETIEKMTIKGLEKFLNDCVSSITYTHSDASYVKSRMFEHIKQIFSPAFDLTYTNYIHYDFTIPIKGFNVKFKIGTKSTGEVIQVTKLKSKNIVGIGKIKIDRISFSYGFPSFKVKEEKTFLSFLFKQSFLIEIKEGSTCGGNTVKIPITSKLTFEEMSKKDYLLEMIQCDYNLVEEENKRRGKDNRVYKNLIEEIGTYAVQPIIQPYYFNGSENKLIKSLPKEYQNKIKNGEMKSFDAVLNVVIENNSELLEKIQADILSN
jgi:hypothetical protein